MNTHTTTKSMCHGAFVALDWFSRWKVEHEWWQTHWCWTFDTAWLVSLAGSFGCAAVVWLKTQRSLEIAPHLCWPRHVLNLQTMSATSGALKITRKFCKTVGWWLLWQYRTRVFYSRCDHLTIVSATRLRAMATVTVYRGTCAARINLHHLTPACMHQASPLFTGVLGAAACMGESLG